MPIHELKPLEAYEVLKSNPGAVYLDVRTEEEFARSHPEGAINVPVVFIKSPGQMEPNEDFLTVVEKILPRERKLVVGCMMGGRSRRACEILEQTGYSDLTNVIGGFGGARDLLGNVIVAGWQEEGLPVSTSTAGRSYREQRAKAGLK